MRFNFFKLGTFLALSLNIVVISSCAPKRISDEEGQILYQNWLDKNKRDVLLALNGGTGPISLISRAGIKTAIVDIEFTENGFCGVMVKRYYTFADNSISLRLFDEPKNEQERISLTRCFQYNSFNEAISGIFI